MTYIPLDRMLLNNGDMLGGGQPLQKVVKSVFRSPWVDSDGTLAHKGTDMVYEISRGTTTVISNTTAEMSIYSPSSTPSDFFSSNRMARLTVYGTILNNSGASQTITIKPRVNTSPLASDGTVSLAASAQPRAFIVEGLFYSPDGATLQCVGSIMIGPINNSSQGTALDFGTAAPAVRQPFISAKVTVSPLSARWSLDFSFKMSGGAATTMVNREFGMIELVAA